MKIFNCLQLIIITTISCSIVYAAGGMVVYDPWNEAQNMTTAANSAKTLLNQAQQIQNQLEVIQYAVKNSGKLSSLQWGNITQLVGKIDTISQEGLALSYASNHIEEQFKKQFPDYGGDSSLHDFSSSYRTWITSALDTFRASLHATELITSDYMTEHNVIELLKGHVTSASGRMQVLQASTEIAAENINQLQELKRIVATQANAQTAYMSSKVSQDSYKENSLHSIEENADTTFPTYQNNPKLGELPKDF